MIPPEVEESRTTSSSAAIQVQHGPFLYDANGFQVVAGQQDDRRPFERLKCSELYKLITSETPYQVPVGNADAFYQACLVHYGLPGSFHVADAVDTLKRLFKVEDGKGKLQVPATLVKLRKSMQTDYEEQVELAAASKEKRMAEIQQQLAAIQQVKVKEALLREELEALQAIQQEYTKSRSKKRKRSPHEGPHEHTADKTASDGVVGNRTMANTNSDDWLDNTVSATTRTRQEGLVNAPAKVPLPVPEVRPTAKGLPAYHATPIGTPVLSGLQGSSGMLQAQGNRLDTLLGALAGRWLMHLTSGRPSYAENAQGRGKVDYELLLGKIFGNENYSQEHSSGISSFVGKLKHKKVTYLVLCDKGDKPGFELVGDVLKVSMEWRMVTKPQETGSALARSGRLHLFFNGKVLDGYIDGLEYGSVPPTALEGRFAGILEEHEVCKLPSWRLDVIHRRRGRGKQSSKKTVASLRSPRSRN